MHLYLNYMYFYGIWANSRLQNSTVKMCLNTMKPGNKAREFAVVCRYTYIVLSLLVRHDHPPVWVHCTGTDAQAINSLGSIKIAKRRRNHVLMYNA